MATILAGRVGERSIGSRSRGTWRHGLTLWQPGVAGVSGLRGIRTAEEEVRRGVTDGEAHDLWQLPVDLEWVAVVLEADPMRCQGAYLNLQTGEVIPCATSDNEIAGDHGLDTRKAEPDRWLFLPCLGSRAVREDMAEFAAMIKYLPMRQRVEQAIEGLGAFHRFRDLIYAEGLDSDWYAFSEQRRIARAREFLAELGVWVTAN
jgi:hypothetical protein